MTKKCNDCNGPLTDGEKVFAIVETVYHELPSRVTYAIDQPHFCIAVMHKRCMNGGDSPYATEIIEPSE